MAEEFEDQGGVAGMDPPSLQRWLTSAVMRRMVRPAALAKRRARAEKARRREGRPHRVEYFHQVDDGYSHLAAQLLRALRETYEVEVVCHLVTEGPGKNLPEPDLLRRLSRLDAGKVAPHYGLRFPESAPAPEPAQLDIATRILSAVEAAAFPDAAVAVGDALWSANQDRLAALAQEWGCTEQEERDARILEGNERRQRLGHYSGAMFHYEGEWYWGADRFYHLEARLADNGLAEDAARQPLCPRPRIEAGPLHDAGSLTLEFYPSLRSPYTSIIFDATLGLARDSGVKLVMRPVMPMVMRGVSLTRQKGVYIFSDTAREAAARGLDWGGFYDPIGEPVRNCYSLFPWARDQGRGNELLGNFLRAAFFECVNTRRESGMQSVVEAAGLNWEEARGILGNRDWEEELEANRLDMYDFGCWGVPSFRLLDADGEEALALWGQDRLWLFAREIQRLLGERRD